MVVLFFSCSAELLCRNLPSQQLVLGLGWHMNTLHQFCTSSPFVLARTH